MKRKLILSCCLAAIVTTGALSVSGLRAADDFVSGEDTVYSIGSVSKVYVTVAAMQLAERGLIDIDEPLVTYIPEFEMADPRYKDITVRMLMDHSSGLMGSTSADNIIIEDNYPCSLDRTLEMMKNERLKADPGDFSVYCNDGFTLLEILVERVSGMSFTEYMDKNIVKPLDCIQTGSYVNAFRSPYQVDIFDSHDRPFAHEYCTNIGEGGVLSTAAELCRFGSTFFTGDTTLLSEKSKRLMNTARSSDKYEGSYGLGWDMVDVFPDSGVKVVTKGGDLINQHAALLVAPDERISVAVCSSGGNSGIDTILAADLMNVVLGEKGIDLMDIPEVSCTISDTIPQEYKKYEGLYASSDIYRVTFPDMKYAVFESFGSRREITYYKYTAEGCLVKMIGDVPNGKGVQDPTSGTISFRERNGKTYIVADESIDFPVLGRFRDPCYELQKLEPGTTDQAYIDAWAARSGYYCCVGDRYSSLNYIDYPVLKLELSKADNSYINGLNILRIKDADTAESVIQIPNNAGRDQTDIYAETVDGKDYIVARDMGLRFISVDCIPELNALPAEVKCSGSEAQWYTIGEDIAGKVIAIDKTEKCSVYIVDRSGKVLFSTYMTGTGGKYPLPAGGMIGFIGETGERIAVTEE